MLLNTVLLKIYRGVVKYLYVFIRLPIYQNYLSVGYIAIIIKLLLQMMNNVVYIDNDDNLSMPLEYFDNDDKLGKPLNCFWFTYIKP